MSDTPDTSGLTRELEDRAYTAMVYLISQLSERYLEKIGDVLTVNDSLMKVVAIVAGEMIACYPEEEREDITGRVARTIDQSRDLLEAEQEQTPVTSESDLAKMTPQGRC